MEGCCTRFTAAEGGARLAVAAANKNILAVEYASFIPVRLLYEKAYQIRGALSSGRKRSVYVTRATRVHVVAYEIKILTDLAAVCSETYQAIADWPAELEQKEVLICTASVLQQVLEEGILTISNINVLVIDSCHLVYKDDDLKYVMRAYKDCPLSHRPIILALTYPLFASPKKELKKEIPSQEHIEEIISIKCQEAIMRDKSNEEELGVCENLDDFDLYEQLEWKIEQLESELCCQMDLAEDIDGGKRISNSQTKPRELIIEYGYRPPEDTIPPEYKELESFMIQTIHEAMEFIEDHRHDPTEIYGEELYEEFMNIPDPGIDPRIMFKQFLYVLDQFGPYAADKAAFALLNKLEKLKVKVPYERHFLLLCLCTTVFVKIRAYADDMFSKSSNEWEKIKKFCAPKLLRFAEILEAFQPPETKVSSKDISTKTNDIGQRDSKISRSDSTKKMLRDISKCDFETLGNKIQDRVNMYEANLKYIEDFSTDVHDNNTAKHASNDIQTASDICDDISVNPTVISNANISGSDSIDKIETVISKSDISAGDIGLNINAKKSGSDINKSDVMDVKIQDVSQKGPVLLPKRTGHRTRGRLRMHRNNTARVLQMQQNPDALCGIVYMKDALVAKIMFMIIVDMSRSNPRLSYLCAQYCATETPADPGTELKECQRQGKMQEEVLKKFRMHECNLLLATSALEEGIDLPRCNLVLRWDVPPSYRSYGLCRGRARATRATSALICSYSTETTQNLLQNVATYRELDQIISRKCGCGVQDEPPQSEEEHADRLNIFIKPYTPKDGLHNTNINERIITHNANSTNDNIKIENNIQISTEYISSSDNVNEVKKDNIMNMGNNKTDDTIEDSNTSSKQIEGNNDCKRQNNNLSGTVSPEYEAKSENKFDNTLEATIKNKDSQPDNLYIESKDVSQVFKNDNHNNSISEKNKKNVGCNIDGISNKTAGIKIEDSLNDVDDWKSTDFEICYDKKSGVSDSEICHSEISRNDIQKINNNNHTKDNIPRINKKVKEIENSHVSDNDIKLNVLCNKCGNIKSNECPCVPKDNISKSYIIKSDTKAINDSECASVDLNYAIALINRYCGKLPSDTFTRLAPQWWMETVQLPHKDTKEMKTAYICTLRLPLNCPVKYNIVGHPMPTRVLARRMVALQACRILHKSGELDNQLMPIGKENFKSAELETANVVVCANNDTVDSNDSARPGTTKRRQYYYKRTASAFTDCQPVVDSKDSEIDSPESMISEPQAAPHEKPKGTKRNMLYAIVSSLWCALPERYNTRGRRLHAPQNASQAIGILMAREEPDSLQIPAFPVYTRSGEVRVSVEHVPDADVRLSPRRGRLVRRFMRFVFADVLRVRRRGMRLQSDGSTHNNYYVVPTIKSTRPDGTMKIDIDWSFLELIYQHTEDKKLSGVDSALLWKNKEDEEPNKPTKGARDKKNKVKKMDNPLLSPDETFVFDCEKYKDAVVTPWYRNQDQPQFFLVAEICWNLTPDSSFPSTSHASFRDYYSSKYGVTLTQKDQPLLDVDHTSARLNLLTPRYVNRKGVALPVSSERTRRAKRDRLDQKQILVPELCRLHPFAAPLWFAAVALPCVLYRINALLIADEIRRAVAIDVGLGMPKINEKTMPGFQWPALDFGWSLAEVLGADFEKTEKKKEEEESKKEQRDKEEKEKLQEERQEIEVENENKLEEVKEKTINDILQEKEDAASSFEIGMWSNEMASAIPENSEYDEYMEPLPPNLTFCTSASGGTNWCDPIEKPKFSQFNPTRIYSMVDSDCSYISSDLDSDDTDLDYDDSDVEADNGFCCYRNTNMAMGVRIEYKTAHEAEAVDLERTKKVNPAPLPDEEDDALDKEEHGRIMKTGVAPEEYIERFRTSVIHHKRAIVEKGDLITKDQPLREILPDTKNKPTSSSDISRDTAISDLFPFGSDGLVVRNGQVDIGSIEKNKRILMEDIKKLLKKEELKNLNCFAMKDIDIDSPGFINEKVVNVGFDSKETYEERCKRTEEFTPYYVEGKQSGKEFDFDYQPKLEGHPGPSPSLILQALTMSNANDGINLERLETIGDSFLKFAITAYLYCAHPTVHEGKLSHMRSKQVSNLNLYRLGRNKRLGARMIASKFEPHDNWLPPCHRPPPTLHPGVHGEVQLEALNPEVPMDAAGCFIPYNLITQHSIPDKSIADCVEALIGAYLLECGPRGALLFMSWLGIKVLPCHHVRLEPDHPYVVAANNADIQQNNPPEEPPSPKRHRTTSSSSECYSSDDEPQQHQELFPDVDWSWPGRAVGSLRPYIDENGVWMQPIFGELKAPPSPLLRYIEDPEGELDQMLSGYDALERTLQYHFKDRSLLLQALTHASHQSNRLTDCYQRLEFLGDAILDYLITRHLYEDPRRHSPGALTDLRSALVNNTIFATLAARHGFHKYFRHMSPGLNEVLTKYVKIQEENGHSISEEHYLIQEDEMEQAEDVEVPKALGDLFESVAGAIFLDSGMSLAAVWKSYVNLMGAELEAFSAAAPKSPVRELLEAEPDTAKFGKPERLADGRRVRVCVEVFGRGTFKGVGRNYRIAKGTAARCALRHLRIHRIH